MRATTYLGDDILPRGKKARAILAYLCFAFGTKVPRVRLASMLWDRASDEQARTSFRRALSDLTLTMGPLAAELILTGRATVRLNTNACWIDALAMLESSYRDSGRSDLAVLCAGELLEGLEDVSATFDRWLRQQRLTLTGKLRSALDAVLLDQINQPGVSPEQVARIARRLISFDPVHQGASRVLMSALAQLGETTQALREYDRCHEALMTTLHVEPSTETKREYEKILTRTERTVKAIARPSAKADADAHNVVSNRNRLRVGVLPFDAQDSEHARNLAFSLSHEVAGALARFRWFDVIAPALVIDIPLASGLGNPQRQQLDYAVDGAVTRHDGHLEINVRLLDLSKSTQPIWSARFELAGDELHRLNELVVGRIVASIDPVILLIEGQPKRKERSGATGMLLEAIPLIYSMERTKFQQAGHLIERALEIEPDNPMALTSLAYWHLWHVGQCWTPNPAGTLSQVENLCLKAMEIDPENSDAMGIYAHTRSWKREFDSAVRFFDRALRVNPNLAYIWALSAPTYCYIGQPDNALKRLSRYLDLSPRDPYAGFFESFLTIARTFKRDYERAVVVGRRSVKTNPEFINGYKPLIASLGHLGRAHDAKPYLEKLLSLEPDFTLQKFHQGYPFKFAHDRDNYIEGLRLAGVPEF
jgi:DNA-binding SARP family transcriptional activator/Tfp pilus assembly protein PilF